MAQSRLPLSPSSRWRQLVGALLGQLLLIWMATLRLRLREPTERDARPWVLSFFHGTQVPLYRWRRRRPTVALVSWSRDGDLQAASLTRLGMRVIRGSSSRGGAAGLLGVVREIVAGCDAAFAVDGPKGPYGEVKPGAIAAAKRANAMLVPMGTACANAIHLRRAWDKLAIPLPFTRIAVVIGQPIDPNADNAVVLLSEAILLANRDAAALL